MATAAATPIEQGKQIRLPDFEGYKVPTARFKFAGALELALTSPEDIALAKALSLGKEGTVTLKVEGKEMTLAARVTSRAHRFRKQEHSDSLVATHTITVNSLAGEDEDEPDED